MVIKKERKKGIKRLILIVVKSLLISIFWQVWLYCWPYLLFIQTHQGNGIISFNLRAARAYSSSSSTVIRRTKEKMAVVDLHVVMVPWSAFSHIMPFFQLSIALAKAGAKISFISTPKSIQRLPKIPPNLIPLIYWPSGNSIAELKRQRSLARRCRSWTFRLRKFSTWKFHISCSNSSSNFIQSISRLDHSWCYCSLGGGDSPSTWCLAYGSFSMLSFNSCIHVASTLSCRRWPEKVPVLTGKFDKTTRMVWLSLLHSFQASWGYWIPGRVLWR